MSKEQLPLRGLVLQEALDATLHARNKMYGEPFPDMDFAAQLEQLYKHHAGSKYHRAHDEALFRVFMKIARIACGAPRNRDTYVDAAAYMAIAFECQEEAERYAMTEKTHASDCALHNGPAMKPGNCDCGADPAMTPEKYGSEMFVDKGRPGGDETAIASAHRSKDGKIYFDKIVRVKASEVITEQNKAAARSFIDVHKDKAPAPPHTQYGPPSGDRVPVIGLMFIPDPSRPDDKWQIVKLETDNLFYARSDRNRGRTVPMTRAYLHRALGVEPVEPYTPPEPEPVTSKTDMCMYCHPEIGDALGVCEEHSVRAAT